ncbi:MAG: protease complex subunit PrcB family protein [Massilia sp.]
MSMFGRVMPPLGAIVVGAALSACGGGSTMHDQQASQGIAVGEPSPAALATAPFVDMARNAACAETKNRLFVIDGKQVFWDHAGRCADAAYEQVLFGAKPESRLCSYGDTIAGPKTYCQDESARALFETIVKHADQPDLGLGSGHKVEQLAFLPPAGTAIAYETVASDNLSGVTARQTVVIRDQPAWDKLWSQHTAGRTPAPAAPKVDFTRKMLVGVFAGEYGNACHSLSVARVAAGATKLEVEVDEHDVTTVAICAPVVSHPMQIVAVDRVDADVATVPVALTGIPFQTADATSISNIHEARTVVVKDAAAWTRLWNEHAPGRALPAVDFAKDMVVGVFMGAGASSCYTTGIDGVARTADRIIVHETRSVPGPDIMCAMLVTTPAHLVVIPRSDLPVEFAAEVATR